MPDSTDLNAILEAGELQPLNSLELETFRITGKYPDRVCAIIYRTQLETVEHAIAMLGVSCLALFDAAYTRLGVPYEKRVQLGTAVGPGSGEWWMRTMRRIRGQEKQPYKFMRDVPDDRFPEEAVMLSAKIDRLVTQTTELVEKAYWLVTTPERLAKVRAHKEEMRRQREERNRRRKTERIARLRAAARRERDLARARQAQRVEAEPVHEDPVMCFKCGKRRAVDAGLCAPCATWAEHAEAAKR